MVMSVKGEDGLRAWQRLKQRFEPGLAARQGMVLAEFSGMIARPAKNTGETLTLITELEKKKKTVEDVTGEEISDMHAKSVLIGILDPTTRQHTAMEHTRDYDSLKNIIEEFANNATAKSDPMQIGRLEDSGGEGHHGEGEWGHQGHDEYVGALGKGSGKTGCYRCG